MGPHPDACEDMVKSRQVSHDEWLVAQVCATSGDLSQSDPLKISDSQSSLCPVPGSELRKVSRSYIR